MSLVSNEMTPADIAAVTGGNNNNSWEGNGAWWLIVLFLFAIMGGAGFGNGGNNAVPFMMNNNTGSEIQRGFDQAVLTTGISGLQNTVVNGFAGVTNGFSQAEISANARQMADMNQNFGMQTAIMQQLNTMAMNQQNNCCENRAGIADLKYTIATEACADRAAVTTAVQTVLDKMNQQELDAERRENANLRQQINMMNLAASQVAQTGQLIADNTAQTQYIVNRVAPYPIPSYTVPNPYGSTTTTATGA